MKTPATLNSVCLGVFLCVATTAVRSQPTFDRTIYASDGIGLEATITEPLGFPPSGGFPAIVLVHGYGGNKDEMEPLALSMAAYGYASLAYSVRGQGNSGGVSTIDAERERQDLLEVIQYLRNFPWINPNKIGVAGGSQGGIHSWMAAVSAMPGVCAVAPLLATPDYARALIPNGCFVSGLAHELSLGSVRYSPDRDRVKAFILANQYDSVAVFVDQRDLGRFVDQVHIPVLQGLGWADVLFPVNGGIRAAANLTARSVPIWSCYGTNGHGETLDAEEAAFLLSKMVGWFDRWLKGFSLAQDSLPVVFYCDDGPGWPRHETTSWPPASSRSTRRFYLTENGLAPAPPSSPSSAAFSLRYDTAYTPSMGWIDGYAGPAFVQAFVSEPARWVSSPVAQETEITGIPVAHLVCAGDQAFQANVRIYDVVHADTGAVWTLISRGPYGFRTPSLGEAAFECNALSHMLLPGHSLGIEVTSLDMQSSGAAHTIPYFASTHAEVLSSPASPSYIDVPWPYATGASFADAVLPSRVFLYQNYPNPFNPSTTIRFRLQRSSAVKIEVFDVLGRRVAILVDGVVPAGDHAVAFDAAARVSGTYFVRLTGGGGMQVRRMQLVK